MALRRDDWLDLGRKVDWNFRYVDEREVFPEALSGTPWLPHAAWEDWTEAYRTSYRELNLGLLGSEAPGVVPHLQLARAGVGGPPIGANGAGPDPVSPTCENVIRGTPGDDILRGTAAADCIFGAGGNDTLYGEGGRDLLFGDGGNSILGELGRGGDDVLNGTASDVSNPGNDRLEGGDGGDVLYGGFGEDILLGQAGPDFMYGDRRSHGPGEALHRDCRRQ